MDKAQWAVAMTQAAMAVQFQGHETPNQRLNLALRFYKAFEASVAEGKEAFAAAEQELAAPPSGTPSEGGWGWKFIEI